MTSKLIDFEMYRYVQIYIISRATLLKSSTEMIIKVIREISKRIAIYNFHNIQNRICIFVLIKFHAKLEAQNFEV